MKEIIKNTVIITVITLIAGLFLGVVYDVTKEPIAHQQELARTQARQAVFAEADHFEDMELDQQAISTALAEEGFAVQTIDEVAQAMDGTDNLLGYVITVTTNQGYGGDITFTMGVAEDGTMKGLSFLSISETAGLGMKADTKEFKNQFADKAVDAFTYTKNDAAADNEIDALSGATITTKAVTDGVNAGLAASRYLKGGQTS